MSDFHSSISLGLTEYIGLLRPMAAGLFAAAAMARLTRVTQGKRLFTLRKKCPVLKHHAGMMAKKSSKSGKCPILWNISDIKLLHSYQF
jgi:hypothetical protein